MEIRWSVEAADDLTRIIQYIREQNLSAAERVAHSIFDEITTLEQFPLSGRVGA